MRALEDWEPIVNLGLPRTGTTSLACSLFALGLRSVHDGIGTDAGRNASLQFPVPIPHRRVLPSWLGFAFRREILVAWMDALLDPAHPRHASVLAPLRAYDAFGDNPFYGVDGHSVPFRERLRAVVPGARFVCTTRSRETWLRSMTTRHPYAGGAYLAGLANTTMPFRDRGKLGAFFDAHYAEECDGVPTFSFDHCALPGCADAWGWLSLSLLGRYPQAAARAQRLRGAQTAWTASESIRKLRSANATGGVGVGCPFAI